MESNGVRAAVRLTQLRGRIERWRRTRAKRSPIQTCGAGTLRSHLPTSSVATCPFGKRA